MEFKFRTNVFKNDPSQNKNNNPKFPTHGGTLEMPLGQLQEYVEYLHWAAKTELFQSRIKNRVNSLHTGIMGFVSRQPRTSMEGEFTMYLPSQFNPRTGEMETDIPRRDIFDEIMANTLATMPLTIMPLMRAGDNGNLKMEFSEPSTEACWIAELVGERVVGEEMDATTDHAWLVVMGYLGQALGLIT